ncbi:MAG: hypothetical protein JWM86_2327, partial [Thermoleophilia bacterium]|nr:hypothetical protein [Thermoleophilia bacterium]
MLAQAAHAGGSIARLGETVAARMSDEFVESVRARGMANVDVQLTPLAPELVDAVATELAGALAWVNNGQCSERALVSAL